jgi:anti-anti-sigma regulatory factor
MSVTLHQDEARCLIRLDGEVGMQCAAELKNALLQALASGTEVCVDIEQASELGISALQLLGAADRQAQGSGHRLALTGGVPEAIAAAVKDAGFEQFPIVLDSTET